VTAVVEYVARVNKRERKRALRREIFVFAGSAGTATGGRGIARVSVCEVTHADLKVGARKNRDEDAGRIVVRNGRAR
jgi:hypothetical protein